LLVRMYSERTVELAAIAAEYFSLGKGCLR